MSKKSRKKTSKKTSKTAIPKTVKPKSAVRTKTKKAKIPGAAAAKSGKTTTKTAAGPASHKATPKRLNFSNKAAGPAAGKRGSAVDNKTTLVEGQKAPAFHLPRDGGGTAGLSDYAGRKLVLFFYPRADTPGCTREAIDFTRLADAFAAAGTAVLGVSADPIKAQDKFRDKHGLAVPLISDERHEMLEAYGAWGEKSLYGRKFLGIIRTTVLIDASGQIAKVWRNVKVDGHAEAVLAAAQAL
jgi:thioredoxin-dependent peroxiredoxin